MYHSSFIFYKYIMMMKVFCGKVMAFIKILEDRIKNSLQTYKKVEIQNLSSQHYGHNNVSSHSHLHLIVISNDFTNLSRIDRQRKINSLFVNEFKNNEIHALIFDLKTENEFIAD